MVKKTLFCFFFSFLAFFYSSTLMAQTTPQPQRISTPTPQVCMPTAPRMELSAIIASMRELANITANPETVEAKTRMMSEQIDIRAGEIARPDISSEAIAKNETEISEILRAGKDITFTVSINRKEPGEKNKIIYSLTVTIDQALFDEGLRRTDVSPLHTVFLLLSEQKAVSPQAMSLVNVVGSMTAAEFDRASSPAETMLPLRHAASSLERASFVSYSPIRTLTFQTILREIPRNELSATAIISAIRKSLLTIHELLELRKSNRIGEIHIPSTLAHTVSLGLAMATTSTTPYQLFLSHTDSGELHAIDPSRSAMELDILLRGLFGEQVRLGNVLLLSSTGLFNLMSDENVPVVLRDAEISRALTKLSRVLKNDSGSAILASDFRELIRQRVQILRAAPRRAAEAMRAENRSVSRAITRIEDARTRGGK